MWTAAVAVLSAFGWIAATGQEARAGAEAASPPLSIAVMVSSRHDVCFDPGDVGAIKALTTREQERLNRQGGVHGRRIELRFLDDDGKADRTTENLRTAMSDPSTLAIVGLTSSNRAKEAFDALGKELRASAIPYLSNISVTNLFKDMPNVFTSQSSQDEERVPVMAKFIQRMRFQRVAFAGLADAVYSSAIGDGLRKQLDEGLIMADHRLLSQKEPKDGLQSQKEQKEGLQTQKEQKEVFDEGQLAAAIADIKARNPDLVVLGISGARAGEFIRAMVVAGVTPPTFVAGRIDSLPVELVKAYPSALYQLAWDALPETDNDRLRQLMSRDAPENWVFEGRRIATAPGWANGECKPRAESDANDPLTSANQRAIGRGALHADMVALVAEAARSARHGASVAGLRRQVIEQLTTTYAAGRGVFKGSYDSWSFQSSTRSAARTPFVVVHPPGLDRAQLAPVQFVRVKNGALRQIDTLYVDIDLIRAHRIEDNEKTFFAEFYLSMRDNKNASIESIDFTNSFIDPRTNGRQITVEVLHGGGASDSYPESMKIYKVAGRFTFEPEMSRYPFDTQRFAINVQSKRADHPFVVQPPPADLRDKVVATDGWDVKGQYVGYSEDVVPILDAFTLAPSVVPFHKSSFVWLMKRQTTDYFLRVVVPLGFILIVAYMSFFISTDHFEAIVTIQVTALLSAVALYLSLPKLDSDDATISDRLFVFNYMMVSMMIGISILRVSPYVTDRPWFKNLLRLAHVAGIPAMMGAMALYVYRLIEI